MPETIEPAIDNLPEIDLSAPVPEPGLGGFGDPDPEPEPEPELETEPEAAPSPVLIGEREYTLEELERLAQAAQEYESKRSSIEPLEQVAQAISAWPAEIQQEFFSQVEAMQERASGIAIPPAEVRLPELDAEDLAEGEAKVYKALRKPMEQLMAQNAGLLRVIADQRRELAEIKGVLPDVRDFVGQTRAERANAQAAESLAARYGVQVAATDVAKAMRDTGVQDPEAAWLKANAASLLRAPARQEREKPNAPGGTQDGRTFNADGMPPSEVMKRLAQGMKPV